MAFGTSHRVGLNTSQYLYGLTLTSWPWVYALISGCFGGGVRVSRQMSTAVAADANNATATSTAKPFFTRGAPPRDRFLFRSSSVHLPAPRGSGDYRRDRESANRRGSS